MYSMPQHAVTNGYWKIEYFRAQPIASSSRLVKNPPSPDISCPPFLLPFGGAVVPGVEKPGHVHAEEDDDLGQAQHTEIAEHDRPRIQEDELDVEEDEENGGQG